MSETNKFPFDMREEYFKFLNHEPTKIVVNQLVASAETGFGALPGPWIEKGPIGGGYDGFGVRWITPASGGGAPIPAPGEFLLEDICDWREVVKFPDLDAFDWAADAEAALAQVDRTVQAVNFGLGNGVYERLAALMGFEEALCAMVTDPEEVNAFFTALTDWKIEFVKKIKKYYHPDTITYFDDIATERDLFMSPDAYRKLIKPHHKRFAQAVTNMGIKPILHCCGHAEVIVEDMIDCGWVAWNSVQPSNDIVALCEKYGDRIGFIGGFDSNGRPAQPDATEEEARAEIRRCIDTYGATERGFCLFAFKVVNSRDPAVIGAAMAPLFEEYFTYTSQKLMAAGNTQS
ncbi:MAG: hypothetical protein LIO86_05615 [Lachnospiraceae bacterium]|nr:hypothetical protein [Lachnospiraceae bacterium]